VESETPLHFAGFINVQYGWSPRTLDKLNKLRTIDRVKNIPWYHHSLGSHDSDDITIVWHWQREQLDGHLHVCWEGRKWEFVI